MTPTIRYVILRKSFNKKIREVSQRFTIKDCIGKATGFRSWKGFAFRFSKALIIQKFYLPERFLGKENICGYLLPEDFH